MTIMAQFKHYEEEGGIGIWFNIPDERPNKRMKEDPDFVPDVLFTLDIFLYNRHTDAVIFKEITHKEYLQKILHVFFYK